MNIKKITIAMLGAALLAGCASLEERLASDNQYIKFAAERELVNNSRMGGSEAERIAAINRVTDQQLLFQIAQNAKESEHTLPDGLAATEKISSMDSYLKLVKTAIDVKVKLAAMRKISDQKMLLDIASKARDRSVKIEAIQKISDKSSLLPIVFKPQNAVQPSVDPLVSKRQQVYRQMSDVKVPNVPTGKLDHELISMFLAECKDETLLTQIVNEYGALLTEGHLAAIKSNCPSMEKNIAMIADTQKANQLRALIVSRKYDDEKILEGLKAIESSKLRASLFGEVCKHIYMFEKFTSLFTTVESVIVAVQKMEEDGKADKIDDFVKALPECMVVELLKKYEGKHDKIARQVRLGVVDNLNVVDQEILARIIQLVPADQEFRYSFWADGSFVKRIQSSAVADAFVERFGGLGCEYVLPKLSSGKLQALVNDALARAKAVENEKLVFGGFYLGMSSFDYKVLSTHYKFSMEYGKCSYGEGGVVTKMKFYNREKFKFIDCEDSNALNQVVHQYVMRKPGKAGEAEYNLKFDAQVDDDMDCWMTYSCTKLGTKIWFHEKSGVLMFTSL